MGTKKRFDLNHLFRNTSWLLLSEIIAKASRLLVIIALAAVLSAEQYGTVMLALACHEIFKLTLRSGAGAQIVQCKKHDLPSYAQNGLILQWLVCLLLMVIQASLASPVGEFYDNALVSELLFYMAGVYCLYPLVSIKVFLIQRAGNMQFFSTRNAACIIAENVSIALFALLDFGIMSVVWGKWVFAFLWVTFFYFAPIKTFAFGFSWAIFKKLSFTSGQLLSTEIVRALRGQLDMLIGAKLLIPEMFGLYSFAKSAGVGLSQSINNAFNTALYPYLCEKCRVNKLPEETQKVYLLTALVGCLFVLQALLVPFYVPVLFDQQWQQNHNVISLLCVAALPALFVDSHCNLLRAKASYRAELIVRCCCLAISAIGLTTLPTESPEAFAFNILLISAVWFLIVIASHNLKPFRTSLQLTSIGSQTHE